MSIQITEEHGVEIRHEPTPEGWIDVVVYNPHSCPWDCYGRRNTNEYRQVFKEAGIESLGLETNCRILHPRGSGPGGRVRFGDDMTPGTYRVAVQAKDQVAALAAIAAHQEAITQWLHHGGPMPEACKQ